MLGCLSFLAAVRTVLGSCEDEVSRLSRIELGRVWDAAVSYDDDPKSLDPDMPWARFISPRNRTCLSRMVGPLAWKRPDSWAKRVVLMPGKVGSGNVLRVQLPLLKSADLVVLVTWKGQLSADHWVRDALKEIHGRVVEVEQVDVDWVTLGTSEHQDALLRAGIEAVQDLVPTMAPVTADVLVIKSRPDALLPKGLAEHIFELDYSLPPEVLGRPFLRRVWIPFLDAVMPFFIADDIFAASLSDLRQLRWPWNAVRHVRGTMSRAGLHIHRWLAPFLQWYPSLFGFRQNLYDLSDKLTDNVPDHPLSKGRRYSNFIIEAACASLLRPEVKDYLVQLLSTYFHLVVNTFRIGGGPCEAGGGVHMLLTVNATIDADGVVSTPRLLPSNLALKCPNLITNRWLVQSWRHRCHPKPGQGLLEVSRKSMFWWKPVYDLNWHVAVLSGSAQPDGLSELIARFPPPLPIHFATLEGFKVSVRYGRFQEPVQTAWCLQLDDMEPISWVDCLRSKPPVGAKACCFPREAFCPSWVASATFLELLNQAGIKKEEEHEQIAYDLTEWCGWGDLEREAKMKQNCKQHKSENSPVGVSMCFLNELATEFLPGFAPRGQAMHRIWKDVPGHRAQRSSKEISLATPIFNCSCTSDAR